MVRILSSHSFVYPSRKRGRPCKKRDGVDLGTKELQEKRREVTLHEVQLTGTIASVLLKHNIMTLSDVESLQKIYILKRRYMNLLEGGRDIRSGMIQPMSSKTCRVYYREQKENLMMEHTWKMLRAYVREKNARFLTFLDNLFRLYSYETLKEAAFLFRTNFSKDTMQTMSKIAEDALHL